MNAATALVPIDRRELDTRLCSTHSCPNEAESGSTRCRRHNVSGGELAELARRAASSHEAAGLALNESIDHAIRCGEALLTAHAMIKKLPTVQWGVWLRENVGVSDRTAYGYMRLSVHRDALPAEALAPFIDARGRRRPASIARAVRAAATLPPVADHVAHFRLSDETRAEILRLHAEGGLSYAEIARRVDVNHVTVARIVDPELAQRERAAERTRKRNITAANRAATDAENEQRISAALATAPPELAEAYLLANRLLALLTDHPVGRARGYVRTAHTAIVAELVG